MNGLVMRRREQKKARVVLARVFDVRTQYDAAVETRRAFGRNRRASSVAAFYDATHARRRVVPLDGFDVSARFEKTSALRERDRMRLDLSHARELRATARDET